MLSSAAARSTSSSALAVTRRSSRPAMRWHSSAAWRRRSTSAASAVTNPSTTSSPWAASARARAASASDRRARVASYAFHAVAGQPEVDEQGVGRLRGHAGREPGPPPVELGLHQRPLGRGQLGRPVGLDRLEGVAQGLAAQRAVALAGEVARPLDRGRGPLARAARAASSTACTRATSALAPSSSARAAS